MSIYRIEMYERYFFFIRGCQSWTINYLSSSFLFCKYRLYSQNKSDWSNHKKPANITVTSRICFFGYPQSKFVFFCFSHKMHARSATRPMVRSKGFTLMQMLKLFLDTLLLQKNRQRWKTFACARE